MARYLLSNLPVELNAVAEPLERLLATALGAKASCFRDPVLERRSLDARHKGRLRFLLNVSFESDPDFSAAPLAPGAKLETAPASVSFQVNAAPRRPKVVIVGTGPAGTFCALRLLDYGIEPILLERGPEMGERVQKVNALWREGTLDVDANAQFGEGGAGTFSDGKLATRTGHPAIRFVLETFVRFGADPKILFLAKPHVGTDVIRGCSVRMRREAQARGAQYRFKTRLADFREEAGRVRAAITSEGEEIPCDALVLAPGHSARDTFEMLVRHGVALRPKPFAMGVRVEQPVDLIDRAQYGPSAGHPSLDPADYRLVCNLNRDRAAYSFCMCPGGEVIQCSSEAGGVVVNGMSNAKRDSGYSNSGLVAKVNTADFGASDPLAGMHLQRRWEQACFRAAGERYGAPAMAVQDFLKGRPTGRLPRTSFRPFAVPADLETCLPDFVLAQLRAALPEFDRKLHGFTSVEAILLAIESRTSSPIQLMRGENGQSPSHAGLYPCGEGAGFAGGITSAAVDGIRVAEWIAQGAGAPVFEPFEKRVKSGDVGTEY
ncbi:MAG: hypothetical protein LWX11_08695 [Firmicutes bacterium]|nr:hypothetical protein [Bacillota bacterium]